MNFEEKYKIIKNNDENYDSAFFYAVKTTGIYCKPSCKSKLPNKENVEFFDNSDSAIKKGYRPCKRCRSDLIEYKPMKELAKMLKLKIENNYTEYELLDNTINKLGISKKRVVEIFQKEYEITPNQYLNNIRLEQSKKLLIETEDSIINIVYSVGFGSSSAFYKTFKDSCNLTPTKYRKENKKAK